MDANTLIPVFHAVYLAFQIGVLALQKVTCYMFACQHVNIHITQPKRITEHIGIFNWCTPIENVC